MDEIEQKDADLSNDEIDLSQEDGANVQEEAPKKEYTLEQKLARVSRMKAKLEKELGLEPPKAEKEPAKSEAKVTPGELDETQLEILELRGYTDEEDIDYIQRYMQRNGLTLRQTLKDEVALGKLNAQKAAREVKDATPSATKRGGGGGNDLALAIAKFDATGELPADFALRSEVVNAIQAKANTNKPGWH